LVENRDFFIPLLSTPRSRGSRRNIVIQFGTENYRIVGLLDGGKTLRICVIV